MADRAVNLWEYLPPFLKQFRELDMLLESEQIELQTLVDNVKKVSIEPFILTADEDGIKIYEKMMGLYPEEGEDLEARRLKIFSLWYDSTPYTIYNLRNLIISIQGNDNISIYLDSVIPYKLNIEINMEKAGMLSALDKILAKIIPANMNVNITNHIIGTTEGTAYFSNGLSITGSVFLTDDVNIDVSSSLEEKAAVGFGITGSQGLWN